MKRFIFLVSFFFALQSNAHAQEIPVSLISQYSTAETEKQKLFFLYKYVYGLESDSAFLPKTRAVINYLASVKDQRNQDLIQLIANDQLSKTGDYATALASCLEILDRFERQNDKKGIFAAYRQLSTSYFYAGDKENDVLYGKKAMVIAIELKDAASLSSIANNISTAYSQKAMPDSALVYGRLAVHYARESGEKERLAGVVSTLAEAFIAAKQYDSALYYSRQALVFEFGKEELAKIWAFNDLSQIFLETQQYDSSEYYARSAADLSHARGYKDQLHRAYDYLSQTFGKTGKPDSAFKYLRVAVAIKDSLYNGEKIRQVQGVMAREQTRLHEIENDKLAWKNKTRIYGLGAGLLILGVIAFMLLRNNRQKKRANKVLEDTLSKLTSTQAQLIQSEKMASLGELTAGIAHEIQNPLNFVNNFSDVNAELVDEVSLEMDKGNIEVAKAILGDIKDNEAKINHHGKRADAIVKGMLQHSRSSSGQKELTDINALADEYLRLAYHGSRAKDKFFNVTLATGFDKQIAPISIVPQDIGKVILNLITNAFYAVNEKYSIAKASGDKNYEPAVSIIIKKIPGKVEVRVEDNGNGIPQKVLDKIFQPFFTTKPTGQGTGLGLSLSYDIVKAHGGEIKVETREREGTMFILQLPVN